MSSMNRRSVLFGTAFSAIMLSLPGCICLPGHTCVPDGGGDPDGPGGVRNPVVEVYKNDSLFGYMTTDADALNVEWWLVESTTTFPYTLSSSDVLSYVPTAPFIMLTKNQFCAEFKPKLTSPKLYRVTTFVNDTATCP